MVTQLMLQFCYLKTNQKWRQSSTGSNTPPCVYKSCCSFCGSEKLHYLWNFVSLLECLPYICTESISYHGPNVMITILRPLNINIIQKLLNELVTICVASEVLRDICETCAPLPWRPLKKLIGNCN